jgi:hypothetical protein
MSKKFLLNELSVANDGRIKDAINRVLRVRITYNDKKPHVISNRRGYKTRYILPVAYGLTKSGKPAVRAYQTSGSSKRGIPRWKLFLLDNIVSWSNGKKSFKEYKNSLLSLGLNTNGDRGMTTIYAITPFADDNVQINPNSTGISSEPVTRNDVEPKTSSQQPDKGMNVDRNLEPAKNSRVSSIDKNKNNSYFNNKVEAPVTEPVSKVDIDGTTNNEPENINNEPETNNIAQKQNTTISQDNLVNEPVTKSDIETDETEKVKNQFNNFMDRMNNLYNDEEDIE